MNFIFNIIGCSSGSGFGDGCGVGGSPGRGDGCGFGFSTGSSEGDGGGRKNGRGADCGRFQTRDGVEWYSGTWEDDELVARDGVEPSTQGFSIPCSTN